MVLNRIFRSKNPGSRSSSVLSSRAVTPNPSHMRDQDIASESFYGASPYDEYSPYNVDGEQGCSRPAPLPYDDPYSDEPVQVRSTSPTPSTNGLSRRGAGPNRSHSRRNEDKPYANQDRRPQRQPRRGMDNSRGRGRGRGHGDGRRHSEKSSMPDGNSGAQQSSRTQPSRRSLSPASLAIARATGQYSDGSTYQIDQSHPQPHSYPGTPTQPLWQQPQVQPHFNPYFQNTSFPLMQPHHQFVPQVPANIQPTYPGVQPHINPRFAAAFGINMNFMQQQGNAFGEFGNGPHANTGGYTSNEWTIPTGAYQHVSNPSDGQGEWEVKRDASG